MATIPSWDLLKALANLLGNTLTVTLDDGTTEEWVVWLRRPDTDDDKGAAQAIVIAEDEGERTRDDDGWEITAGLYVVDKRRRWAAMTVRQAAAAVAEKTHDQEDLLTIPGWHCCMMQVAGYAIGPSDHGDGAAGAIQLRITLEKTD